jgi:hypothetical protein
MNVDSSIPVAAEFKGMPDASRIWIFGASRPLDEGEEGQLLGRVDNFLSGWAAHGHPLAAGRAWIEGRFLIVAVDNTVTPPSGCSIDSLIRELRRLEAEIEVQIVGNAPVWFRGSDGKVMRVNRREFRDLARQSAINLDTMVFDLSLTRLEDLRSGRFEGPARHRWHQSLFG